MTGSGSYTKQVTLTLILLFAFTEAGRPLKIIGLFPHPGLSHFYFFHPIMRGLAEAGHEVTVISHFPDKSPSVRYRDLPLTTNKSGKPNVEGITNSLDLQLFSSRSSLQYLTEFFWLYEYGKESCNTTLRSEALTKVLRERIRYDVVITEAFNTDCMLGIAHMLKAPIVSLSSSALMPWHFERVGIPITPSYMPVLFLGHSHDMSFKERISNWISFHLLNFLYNHITIPSDDAMIQHKFGHNVPSVGEIAKETSLMLVNTHFTLNGVKPLPPSVIEIGGVHIQKAKALPVELQRWLDSADHGAIVVSWGSLIRANSLPAEKRDALLKAFSRLNLRVLWKWENDTIPNKPDNVLTSNWLPQRDVLCHPNVKVFMSHGGLMGSTEATHCGVPMVVTPMFGDQFLNAAALHSRGMAVILPYEEMVESTIMKAIRTVLQKSYADNAKAVAHSYNHRPLTALQTAIWWIEYVARTEGAPLAKSSAVYLSRFSYYSLDVYLVLGIVLGIWIASCMWIIKNLLKRWKKRKEKIH